ncbi:unnamed protein product, partial [Coccothraustes coccothraustes]
TSLNVHLHFWENFPATATNLLVSLQPVLRGELPVLESGCIRFFPVPSTGHIEFVSFTFVLALKRGRAASRQGCEVCGVRSELAALTSVI